MSADAVTVTVEGERALVSFSLKIPGESEARRIVEVLVPASILTSQGLPVGKVG